MLLALAEGSRFIENHRVPQKAAFIRLERCESPITSLRAGDDARPRFRLARLSGPHNPNKRADAVVARPAAGRSPRARAAPPTPAPPRTTPDPPEGLVPNPARGCDSRGTCRGADHSSGSADAHRRSPGRRRTAPDMGGGLRPPNHTPSARTTPDPAWLGLTRPYPDALRSHDACEAGDPAFSNNLSYELK